ncbi:hypothetical protein [Streptococcus sp. zg-JUN1979]|uniref:hypothetical protein n=1 Tax=Streptococcus sp. zg-JUN1979 TaxID=3391450 RepID=UPI0039A5EC35
MKKRTSRKSYALARQRQMQLRADDKSVVMPAKSSTVVATEVSANQRTKWSKVKSTIPLVLSLVAVSLSGASLYLTQAKTEVVDEAHFTLVQNLWQDKPSYTLYNESQTPLAILPQTRYAMYVPATLEMTSKEGFKQSQLILLPVDEDTVLSQTSTGQTMDALETSVLPKSFYAKMTSGQLRHKAYGTKGKDEMTFELKVYPFLAIETELSYAYRDKPEHMLHETFIATPWSKVALTKARARDLADYKQNMLHFSDNELRLSATSNIYDLAFKQLTKQFDKWLPNMTQKAKSLEDQERFYALMGIKWDTRIDPTKESFLTKVSDLENFNNLGRELSDKLIPAYNPLYPKD